MRHDYTLFKRKNRKVWYVYYYDGNGKRISKSTGQTVKYKAEEVARQLFTIVHTNSVRNRTLREYVDPFYTWDRCPHVRRLLDERKSITRRHVRNQRIWIEKYIFSDVISQKKLGLITRADLIDFRSRLLKEIPNRINTVNKVMSVMKTVFKEALLREEIEKDPTLGLGNIKQDKKEIGTFSYDELNVLFPTDSFGPWQDLNDHTCFLVAATTGLRRGEVLALCWKDIDLGKGLINVISAWKDRDELGKPKWNNVRVTPFLIFRNRTLSRLKELKLKSYKSNPDDLVFCYADGSRFGTTWWQGRFMKAMEGAGIDRISRRLSPHSFRHSLNTILRDAGKDPAKVRVVLGWRHEKTQDSYTHFDIEQYQDLIIME